jgi:hypothetical protein
MTPDNVGTAVLQNNSPMTDCVDPEYSKSFCYIFLFNQEVKLTYSTFTDAVRSTYCNLINCILHVWSTYFPNWRICSTCSVLLQAWLRQTPCFLIFQCVGPVGKAVLQSMISVRCQPAYWRLSMTIWFIAGRPTITTITHHDCHELPYSY